MAAFCRNFIGMRTHKKIGRVAKLVAAAVLVCSLGGGKVARPIVTAPPRPVVHGKVG